MVVESCTKLQVLEVFSGCRELYKVSGVVKV